MFQLVLSLAMEMDGDSEKDKATLDALLSSLLTDLLQLSDDVVAMAVRTPRHEVELVVLRLLSVLMSRARSPNKSSSEVLIICTVTMKYWYMHCWRCCSLTGLTI
jgi:E3 ubiquitin-protein ligase UBR4